MDAFHTYQECVDYIEKHFALEIDNEFTMAGVIVHYLAKLRKNWCDETTRSSLRLYIVHILPYFADHPLKEYTDDQYFCDVWEKIRRKGPRSENDRVCTVHRPYGPDYMIRIRFLMRHVILIGESYGVCPDVLYASDFARPDYGLPKDFIVKNLEKLTKSFTALMEYMIAEEIFTDPMQDGEKMLLLNMYLTAARNTEAAAIPWNCLRQVDCYDNIYALWIEYSKDGRSNNSKIGSKSPNAFRFSVLAQKATAFYLTRKEHILQLIKNNELDAAAEDVEKWPIGCHGKNWSQPCTSQQVTAAAAKLFKKVNLSEEDLAYLELEMEYMNEYKKTELTAYVFRRACATRYYHLGLSQDECFYLMGHSFGSKDKRKKLSSPDRLKRMYDKIVLHPIVGDLDLDRMQITMEGRHLDVVLVRDQELLIPCTGQQIEIQYAPYENGTDGKLVMELVLETGENGEIPFSYSYRKTDDEENETLYLRAEYFDLYREGFEDYKKENVTILEPLVNYLDSERGKAMTSQLQQVLGSIRKAEKAAKNRRYTPRVLSPEEYEGKQVNT